MKRQTNKVISSLLTVLFILTQAVGILPFISTQPVLAAGQIITFPDKNLENVVRETLGKLNGDITDTDMEVLTSLIGKGRGIKDLRGLEYATNLTNINLENNLITDLTPLANLTKINTLYLFNNEISNLVPLSNLTNLRFLNLQDNQISDLSPLSSLPQLETIYLGRNKIVDVTPLGSIVSLRSLFLNRNQISDISSLSSLVNMENLGVEINQIKDISVVTNFPKLRHLAFNSNQVSDLTPISNLTQLQNLYFNSNLVTDITPVSNLTQLRTIYMLFNKVVNLEPLSNLQLLQKLYMYSNDVADISVLNNLSALTYADLRVNPLSPDSSVTIQNLINRGVAIDSGAADTTPPVLNITEPLDNYITQNNWVKVKGYSDVSKKLSVNGKSVYQYSATNDNNPYDTNFETVVYLNPGANVITVTVTDNYNDMVTTQTINVFYDPGVIDIPDPNLEAVIRTAINKPTGVITSSDMASITHLTAQVKGIKNLEGLEFAVNLANLVLPENLISDLSPISNLTKLQLLSLIGNQISDLKPLQGLTNLQSLSLNRNKITNLAPIANLTQLTNLTLNGNPITDITPITNLTNLTNLSMNNLDISDLSPIANMINLRTLTANRNLIKDIEPLRNLVKLEYLYLEENQIQDISPLVNLNQLKRLYISNNQIIDLSPLSNLTQLLDLYLYNNQIENLGPLANLTLLQKLKLYNNQVSDISVLDQLPTIKNVDLRVNPLNSLAINTIGNLTSRGVTVEYGGPDTTPPVLTVSQPADNTVTNEGFIVVTGTTSESEFGRVTINGANGPLSTNGSFSRTVALKPGINLIVITADDIAGNTTTVNRTVIYNDGTDTIPPSLTVTSPTDNLTTNQEIINVSGIAEPGSSVTINGLDVIVDSLGQFATTIGLLPGPNVIKVIATDKAGNFNIVERNVYYNQSVEMIQDLTLSANPYNLSGSLTINYKVIWPNAKASIYILDNNNQVVKSIAIDKTTTIGTNTVSWDGKDTAGVKVPPGTYTVLVKAVDDTGLMSIPQTKTVIASLTPIISNLSNNPEPFINDGTNGVTINYALNIPANVTIGIYNSMNTLVRTLISSQIYGEGPASILWDGTDNLGIKVRDGIYTYKIDAADSLAGFKAVQKRGTITVDSGKPEISNLAVSANPYNTNNNLTINYTLSEEAYVSMKVYDEQGNMVIRDLLNNVKKNAGTNSTSWDGRDNSGVKVPAGTYIIEIKAIDSVGNEAVPQTKTIKASLPPVISNISDTPDPLNNDGINKAIINYNLSIPAVVTISIYNSTNTLVKTLVNEVRPAGPNSIEWDGTDGFGIKVKDGIYTYKIDAVDQVADFKAVQQKGTITVDSGKPEISNFTVSAIPYNTNNNLTISYTLSEEAYVSMKVYDEHGNLVIRDLLNSVKKNAGTNSTSWDGRDNSGVKVPAGTYIIEIKAIDTVGNEAVPQTKTIIASLPPVISNISDTPDPLNNDGINKAIINYNLNIPAVVTINIYNSTNSLVKTLANEVNPAGLNSIEWDGTDDVGIKVKDGTYTYKIDAVDQLADFKAVQQKGTITVDTGKPVISNLTVSANPYNTNSSLTISYNLSEEANVTVKVLDEQLNLIRTIISNYKKSAGNNSTTWDGKDSSGQKVTGGVYTIEVIAVDSIGNNADPQSKTLIASQTPVISNLSDGPDPFVNDGINKAAINYSLSIPSKVTVGIYNSSNVLVKTLITSISKLGGANSIEWDGTDEQGILVRDGVYTYKIDAIDELAGFKAVQQKGTITVDTGKPVISNMKLSQGPYNTNTSLTISYTLSEEANVTITVMDAQGNPVKVLLNNYKKNAGANSTSWDGRDSSGQKVLGGSYTIRIDAVDTIGNIADPQTKTVLASEAPVISNVTNGPDPFAADGTNKATINFTISRTAKVNVKVVDKYGKLIKTLVSDVEMNAGSYTTEWDGSAVEINPVISPWPIVGDGIYNYVIDAVDSVAGFKATYKGSITLDGPNQ